MTTSDQINPFDKIYWNLIQTLAWVHLRKDELVKRADDDVTDWGSHEEEVITPDGVHILAEIPNRRPSALTIELYGSWDGSKYDNLTKASECLIQQLQSGDINCFGIPNNEGDLKEIPLIAWADLRFWYEPSSAAPQDFILRRSATCWHDLKFKRKEILKIWPKCEAVDDTISKRELQKLSTLKRNKKIQIAMEDLAKEKARSGSTFKKQTLANELFLKGEFSGRVLPRFYGHFKEAL